MSISQMPGAGALNPPVAKPRGLDFEMWFYKEGAQHGEEKAPRMPANTPASTSKAVSGPLAIYCGESD